MSCKQICFLSIFVLILLTGVESLQSLKKNKLFSKLMKTKNFRNTLEQDVVFGYDVLVSSNNHYQLINIALGPVRVICQDNTTVWAPSNYQGKLKVQSDGNLVYYDDFDGFVWWETKTGGVGKGPYYLRMEDSGDLVLYGNGVEIWSSNTKGRCTKTLCFTVSEMAESESNNKISLLYRYNYNKYYCEISSPRRGQKYCCEAHFTIIPDDYVIKTLGYYPTRYMIIQTSGTDGVRVKAIDTQGFAGDKFINLRSHDSMMDGKLSGGCFSRFWVDKQGNGHCPRVIVILSYDNHNSSNGPCLRMRCL